MTCEWKSQQLSAKGGIDFRDGIGQLTFPSGVNSTTINVDIIDNSVAELEKTFMVELFNPTGGGNIPFYISVLPSTNRLQCIS